MSHTEFHSYATEILSEEERTNVLAFYTKCLESHHYAHPDWPWQEMCLAKRFVLTFEGPELVAYALVLEAIAGFYPFRLSHASIKLGPLAISEGARAACLLFALQHYKKSGFVKLSFQLPGEVSSNTEIIEAKMAMHGFALRQRHNRLNVCTLHIPLELPLENIRKSYRSPLKRSLKNAQNSGITVRAPLPSEMQRLGELFNEMVTHRGLSKSLQEDFFRILQFAEHQGCGFLLCSYDAYENMLAGGLFLIHGNKVVYQYGFSSPSAKKLPLQHMVFDKVIELAKAKGLATFDLGGYALYATAQDQVAEINRFKWNFTQQLVLSPKLTHVVFKPFQGRMLHKLLGE